MRYQASDHGLRLAGARTWLSRALLVVAVVDLIAAPLLFLATGGFDVRVLGWRVSQHELAKPLLVGLALLAGWAMLAPADAARATKRLDDLSTPARTAITWGIGGLAAVLLSAAKLQQHAVFQTGAFDLGLQATVAWNTAHGRPFYDSIQEISYLGDHFSPVHLVLAGVYRSWPDARALLLVQSAALGLALVAVCRLATRHLDRFSSALLVTVAFALNPYLHRVSSFDFHPAALAIPVLLWLLERIEAGAGIAVVLLAALAATIEETCLPPLVGVGLYAALVRPDLRKTGLALALGAALLFVVELAFLMPYFLGEARLTHIWRYDNLGGGDLGGIVRAVARDPFVLVREWVRPIDKLFALGRLLASFGFFPLLAPPELALALIPIAIVQVGRYAPQWGFEGQYAATALPLLAFAAIHGLARGRRIAAPLVAWWAMRPPFAVGLAAVAIVTALAGEISATPPYLRRWSREHVAAARQMVASVPPGASVCAAQYLVAHLADRTRVSMFRPDGKGGVELDDADVVLLDTRAEGWRGWPFETDEIQPAVRGVLANPAYTIAAEAEGLVLLRRRPP